MGGRLMSAKYQQQIRKACGMATLTRFYFARTQPFRSNYHMQGTAFSIQEMSYNECNTRMMSFPFHECTKEKKYLMQKCAKEYF